MKRKLNVCLTPDLYNYYNNDNNITVVVDILRATTVISTAFHYGVKEIIVVSSLDEASKYLNKDNYIVAAERNAQPLEGFDYGNSPFQYMNNEVKDKTLVLTTTNGTKSIKIARDAVVITSSYVNIDAVFNYIMNSKRDVVILCAGWKGLVNMEDSIFAGNLSDKILSSSNFQTSCDSTLLVKELYKSAGGDLFTFLKPSAHRERLKHLDMEEDTRFCLKPTFSSEIVPYLLEDKLMSNII